MWSLIFQEFRTDITLSTAALPHIIQADVVLFLAGSGIMSCESFFYNTNTPAGFVMPTSTNASNNAFAYMKANNSNWPR